MQIPDNCIAPLLFQPYPFLFVTWIYWFEKAHCTKFQSLATIAVTIWREHHKTDHGNGTHFSSLDEYGFVASVPALCQGNRVIQFHENEQTPQDYRIAGAAFTNNSLFIQFNTPWPYVSELSEGFPLVPKLEQSKIQFFFFIPATCSFFFRKWLTNHHLQYHCTKYHKIVFPTNKLKYTTRWYSLQSTKANPLWHSPYPNLNSIKQTQHTKKPY